MRLCDRVCARRNGNASTGARWNMRCPEVFGHAESLRDSRERGFLGTWTEHGPGQDRSVWSVSPQTAMWQTHLQTLRVSELRPCLHRSSPFQPTQDAQRDVPATKPITRGVRGVRSGELCVRPCTSKARRSPVLLDRRTAAFNWVVVRRPPQFSRPCAVLAPLLSDTYCVVRPVSLPRNSGLSSGADSTSLELQK